MAKDKSTWIIAGATVLAAIIGYLALVKPTSAQTNAQGVSLIDYRWCTCNPVTAGQTCLIYATVSNPSTGVMQATFTITVNGVVISSQPVSIPVGSNEVQIGSYIIPDFTGSQSFNLVVTIS